MTPHPPTVEDFVLKNTVFWRLPFGTVFFGNGSTDISDLGLIENVKKCFSHLPEIIISEVSHYNNDRNDDFSSVDNNWSLSKEIMLFNIMLMKMMMMIKKDGQLLTERWPVPACSKKPVPAPVCTLLQIIKVVMMIFILIISESFWWSHWELYWEWLLVQLTIEDDIKIKIRFQETKQAGNSCITRPTRLGKRFNYHYTNYHWSAYLSQLNKSLFQNTTFLGVWDVRNQRNWQTYWR